jgi:hypothetical protein
MTETLISADTEGSININGFSALINSCKDKKGGGVGLLFNDQLHLKCKLRQDLTAGESLCFESLFAQLDGRASKTNDVIIGVVYKPPDVDMGLFISQFEKVLGTIQKEKKYAMYLEITI